MKKFLLLAMFIVLGQNSFGQALSAYTFSAFSSPYAPVTGGTGPIPATGGTTWGSTAWDDCIYDNIPIGFSFVYCGNTYTSVSASQNAWIVLGQVFPTSMVNTYDNDLSNTSTGTFGNYDLPRPILAALWTDIITTSACVYYRTTGTAPNRVFTIEWRNMDFYSGTGSGGTPRESIEIKLYETTNIIDFAYDFIATGTPSLGRHSIGITDGVGAAPVTGTQLFWSLNSTGTSPTPSMTTESRNLTGQPAANQVYRWDPNCAGVPVAGMVVPSDSIGCATYTSTLTLTGSSLSLGLRYQWQSSPDSLSWTSITGATNNTYVATVTADIFYRCIVSCAYTAFSDTTDGNKLLLYSPPVAITGPTSVCVGSTITLSDATPAGTWASGSTGIATIGSSSGVVTGVSPGTSAITYRLPTGCLITTTITVLSTPGPITGSMTVCTGFTTTLSDAISGGTWTSSAPGTATVGTGTGVVTGVIPGTTVITYTLSTGCFRVATVTVNPSPGPITGPTAVCVGSTITVSDATVGGTWVSSNPGVATVGSASGIVTGVSAGGVVVSYVMPTGCAATYSIIVNALPASIAGLFNVCVGATTTLVSSGSGTWTSSAPGTAVVGASSGIVTGMSPGTATITYTLPTGCLTTATVTVYANPAPITGPTSLCVGTSITLSDATPGGFWSSGSTGVATINFITGVLNGVSAGTAVISYLAPGGCYATTTITVNPLPGVITGVTNVCVGYTSSLFNSLPGGTWSSSNPAVGTIGSSSGIVTGISPGLATITYTLPTGCRTTIGISVYPSPAPISGITSICPGATTTLSDPTFGGTWSSSTPATATIGSSTGVVTGLVPGTTVISYTLFPTGCFATTTVTVTPPPAAISGPTNVCVGVSITLSDPTPGGTWSSSAPAVATVGSLTGIVTGVIGGTAIITYSTGAGCRAVLTITVNPGPAPITGLSTLCIGSTTLLSDATPGGSWTSSSPGIATIGSSTGLVTAVATGSSIITYATGTGCVRTHTMTVTSGPPPISGPSSVCIGGTITLSDAGGGTWTSSAPAIATVGLSTGIVSGITVGSATITYSLGSGCVTTKSVAVIPLPAAISGPGNVCVGSTIVLSDATPGGTWSSTSGTGSITIGTTSGVVSGLTVGSAFVTYTAPSGCFITTTINVAPLPSAIAGPSAVCVGSTITLTNSGGGTWTSGGGTGSATIGLTTGIITGVTMGTVGITYTLPVTGCVTTTTITVTPTPTAIIGAATVCQGATTTFSDAIAGGTWTSGSPAIAAVGLSSGIVTGVSGGTAVITYSLGGGCTATKSITVNPVTPITGITGLCLGNTSTLSNSTPGGTWSSSIPSVATISGVGLVTSVGVGSTVITYTFTSGCIATVTVTVNSVPSPVSGPGQVCIGSAITLSDATGGGTWASSNPSVATVGISSGMVTGAATGTVTITYSIGFGCTVTHTVAVNPLPAAITGITTLCVGLSGTVSNTTPGGAWSASVGTGSVSITSGGVVTGMTTGTAFVTYTLPSGCFRTRTITVNSGPPPITGNLSMCQGQTTSLSDAATGGAWSSSAPAVATVSGVGLVTGVAAGIANISYTVSGCAAFVTVTVVANPGPIIVPAPGTICVGIPATLSDATTGGVWATGDPTVATIVSGTGVITGVSSGTVLVSYTMGSGCRVISSVIVNPVSPIVGPSTVCQFMSITLSDTTMGGTWSSRTPAIATATTTSMFTGSVTGVTVGTTIISYTLPTGCYATHSVSVLPAPPVITGVPSVCVGQVTVLSNAVSGGTWSSSNPAVATVTGGLVLGITPGTTVISYTLGTGCPRLLTVTVFGLPPAIAGSPNVCVGQTTLLTNPAIGGTWTSGATGIATIGLTSGIVSGLTVGTAPITYTIGTGCVTTSFINVIPNPAPITGSPNVCLGFTTTLANTTFGGAWSSSTPSIASVNPSTGDVLGVATGTATITYLMPSGCYVTFPIVVNPLPPAIVGSPNICEGATAILTNPATGGTWTSSNPGYATIGASTGFVNAIAAGTTTIVYTIGSSGCFTTMNLTVDPMPTVIGGSTNICVTTSSTLTNGLPGGAWTSSNTNATIDIATGVVTGVAPGTATITYMMPSGCYVTIPVSISPLPTAISGHPYVCIGSTVTFSDGVPGGIWSSTNTTVAPIGSLTGTVYGANLGTSVINYTLGPGCVASLPISVVPLPVIFSVTGGGNYCSGTGGVHIGLNGSQVGTNYLLYRGSTPTGTFVGTGIALDFGLQTVGGVYTVVAINTPSGCSQLMAGTATIGVIPSVTPSVTMLIPTTDTVCTGASATFTALPVNGGSSPTYVWSVNGVNVALGNTYAFIPADGDMVKVTMTSNATCAAPLTATNEVRMSVLPQGIPTATLTADPGDHVCTGTEVSVIAAAEFGGTAPSFIWRVNGVTVPGVSGGVLAYEPDNGDVIYCAMTSNYPCRLAPTATSNSVRMIVDTPVTPIVVVDGVPGTEIGWGQYDTLVATVTSGVGPFAYQWILNGVPVVGATTNTYISNKFNHPKQDSVACMVTSSGICPVTTFGWVYINSTNVGVKPVLNGANDITVIPNPNQGVFVVKGTLATTTDEEVTMEVTNVLGQVVYKELVTAKQGKLNQQIQLSKTLANGMYILSLRTGSESRVFHVVVQQ